MSARLLIEQAEELDRSTTRDWCDDFDIIGTRAKINGNVVCVAPGEELGGSRALWPANRRFIVAARSLVPALAAELKRATEWKPIATAKKKDMHALECWTTDFGVRVLEWRDGDPNWNICAGWWLAGAEKEGPYEPTHWRELPTGPDAGQMTEEG